MWASMFHVAMCHICWTIHWASSTGRIYILTTIDDVAPCTNNSDFVKIFHQQTSSKQPHMVSWSLQISVILILAQQIPQHAPIISNAVTIASFTSNRTNLCIYSIAHQNLQLPRSLHREPLIAHSTTNTFKYPIYALDTSNHPNLHIVHVWYTWSELDISNYKIFNRSPEPSPVAYKGW